MFGAIILSCATFSGAAVSALSGFAFAPVAGALLLLIYPKDIVIPLLMICSVTLQAFTLACLRAELSLRRSWRMLAGGAIGVPVSIAILSNIDSHAFKLAFGGFLVLYATSMLLRGHAGKFVGRENALVEMTTGMLGGFVGGLTATPGAIPVLYCDLAGLDKRAQRERVQPFILSMQIYALAMLSLGPGIDPIVWSIYATSLPALFAGAVIGLYMYGRLPEQHFRRIVLVLLLASGVAVASNSQAPMAGSAKAEMLYVNRVFFNYDGR
jgi:uncharacterized protein